MEDGPTSAQSRRGTMGAPPPRFRHETRVLPAVRRMVAGEPQGRPWMTEEKEEAAGTTAGATPFPQSATGAARATKTAAIGRSAGEGELRSAEHARRRR